MHKGTRLNSSLWSEKSNYPNKGGVGKVDINTEKNEPHKRGLRTLEDEGTTKVIQVSFMQFQSIRVQEKRVRTRGSAEG